MPEPHRGPDADQGAVGRQDTDRHWLDRAVELSRQCPPSARAFSVGAVLVDATGNQIATGYSREGDPTEHAEEAALRKAGPISPGTTIYSSLEPCGVRKSRPRPCAVLIRDAGIHRVVYALREPPLFVAGGGADLLHTAGVEVVEYADLADAVRAVNAHLLA